jgi:hypothetical protein
LGEEKEEEEEAGKIPLQSLTLEKSGHFPELELLRLVVDSICEASKNDPIELLVEQHLPST